MPQPPTSEEFSQRVAKTIQALPALPESAEKVRAILRKPDWSVDELLPVVNRDAALSADLVRIANSPLYGHAGQVLSVREAILTLGTVHLENYILVAYSNQVILKHFASLRHLQGYFTHSQHVSGMAYQISRAARASAEEQEVCKLGGLLHNIGRLVIAVATEEWNTQFDKPRTPEEGSQEPADFSLLDACEVGMRVCEKWHFPPVLTQAIGRHHRPVIGDDVNYVALIVYLSEFLIIENLSVQVILADFDPVLLDRLRLTAPVLNRARDNYFDALLD